MTQTGGSVPAASRESGARGNPAAAPDEDAVFAGTDVPVKSLFDSLETQHNLNVFLHLFPSVSRKQALDAMEKQARAHVGRVVHSRGDAVSGMPVFKDTRVPVRNLFDYLAKGYGLDVFLCEFPSVSREQAVRALTMARQILEKDSYGTAADGDSVIHSDPQVMSGMPVFKGTRLPAKNLFDYLAGGDNLHVFLEHFPSANRREQALDALSEAGESLETCVHEAVA